MLLTGSWQYILDYCHTTWGTVPDPMAIPRQYNITANSTSRIIFSNGLFDPWWPGGVLSKCVQLVRLFICQALSI